MPLTIKSKDHCQWDAVALGEVMLRLDPGAGRIRTAREFKVWEGGGEYNVVRGLRRCFGLRTAVVTAVVDSELRNAKTATVNDWGAVLYADGRFYEAPLRENLEILMLLVPTLCVGT